MKEILDNVHHSVDLTHSFVCYSGYDSILLWPIVLIIIA